MRSILEERNFPVDEIRYFASARSAGSTLKWKGRDIVVFNVARQTAYFERVVIASGDSNRQVNALAASVQEKLKEGWNPSLAEGLAQATADLGRRVDVVLSFEIADDVLVARLSSAPLTLNPLAGIDGEASVLTAPAAPAPPPARHEEPPRRRRRHQAPASPPSASRPGSRSPRWRPTRNSRRPRVGPRSGRKRRFPCWTRRSALRVRPAIAITKPRRSGTGPVAPETAAMPVRR